MKWKELYWIVFVRENNLKNYLYREVSDKMFSWGSCSGLFFLAGVIRGVCRPVFFPLLKFDLEAGEEEYLLLESQIDHNAKGSSSSLPLSLVCWLACQQVDQWRYWLLLTCTAISGDQGTGHLIDCLLEEEFYVQCNDLIPPCSCPTSLCRGVYTMCSCDLHGRITWIEIVAVSVCHWKGAIPPFAPSHFLCSFLSLSASKLSWTSNWVGVGSFFCCCLLFWRLGGCCWCSWLADVFCF